MPFAATGSLLGRRSVWLLPPSVGTISARNDMQWNAGDGAAFQIAEDQMNDSRGEKVELALLGPSTTCRSGEIKTALFLKLNAGAKPTSAAS
jgi:hypothetical protein